MSEVKSLLKEEVQKAIDEMKISTLTPIQEMSIPKILEGKNLIALSETGSGKTLAYMLPLISNLIGKPKRPIKVLVITPTKELSEQILSVAKKAARFTNLISTSLYGGKSFSEQEREYKNGYHLLVACPGRLKDHLEKNTIDLSEVECVVLDEADQLMDMGFYPHLKVALEAATNRKQTLLFSATMDEEVKKLTEEFLSDAEVLEFKANKTKSVIIENFCPISEELKYPFIRFLFKHFKIQSGVIFSNTKEEARILFGLLEADKYKVAILEGGMTTHQRKKSLNLLKEKKIKFLVATDVASRGLDIPHVGHVINLSPPQVFESYIHRAGRTARHDNAGMSITLYTKDQEHKLSELQRHLNIKASPLKIKEFNYNLKLDKKSIKLIIPSVFADDEEM